MLTKKGPYVLEFNARMGDPETQVLLPRLHVNLLSLIQSAVEHKLYKELEKTKETQNDSAQKKCVGVVCASRGYPQSAEKGQRITGLGKISGKGKNIFVFHAGTKTQNSAFYTNGGRVLNVVALADDFTTAREKVYGAIEKISFSGMQVRTDIAKDVME